MVGVVYLRMGGRAGCLVVVKIGGVAETVVDGGGIISEDVVGVPGSKVDEAGTDRLLAVAAALVDAPASASVLLAPAVMAAWCRRREDPLLVNYLEDLGKAQDTFGSATRE
ncbi:unnamed protein product [Cuscuta europaea]|uniref:Uncharacterized protein n=1 Tax=Cuscuta europaea TaxID=41803 RepID=A0A9P0ZW88_CUSEU|nr:unnamed protein product [Cuscuta europaea]